MSRFNIPNLAFLISNKVSARDVERALDKLQIEPEKETDIVDAQEVRIAAIQLMLKRYPSLADYVADMNLYVSDAVNRRAKMICFPAYAGLLPVSFLPQFEQAIEKLRFAPDHSLPNPQILAEYLSFFTSSVFNAYFYTMSGLAARHNVWIMAGSTLYFEDNDLRHRTFLFNSTGDLAGFQDKLSVSDTEHAMGIEAANELKIFDSPAGPLALLACDDADHFQIARVAKNMGAKLLLHPSAFRGEFTPLRNATGLNMRIQENHLFGVQSVLVGDTGLGFAAEGAASVFAPIEMTKSKNGILAKTSGRFEPDLLCHPINMDVLYKLRNPYVSDRNPEFIEKYYDQMY